MIVYKLFEAEEVKITDKFIQDILEDIANVRGISKDELQKQIEEKYKKISKNVDPDDPLYENFFKNGIEGLVFEEVQKTPDLYKDYKFNQKILNHMFTLLKGTVPGMFPLKNDQGKLINPIILVYPNPLVDFPPGAETIDTAAAYHGDWLGTMVFNKKFGQALMYYADKKKPKVNFKLFKSNGGEIDDLYVYPLFLIFHEISHLMRNDGNLQRLLKDYIQKNIGKYPNLANRNLDEIAGRIQNYAGDFIINHFIKKMGFPELPVGLFSDKLNYDNMTLREIWDVILESLNKNMESAKKVLDKNLDDHMNQKGDNISDNPENAGEGLAQDQQGQGQGQQSQGNDQQGQGQGQQSQSSTQQGSNQQGSNQQGSNQNVGGNGDPFKDIENVLKQAAEKLKNTDVEKAKEQANKEAQRSSEEKRAMEKEREKIKQQLSGNEGKLDIKFDVNKEPLFNWKTIIKRMLSNSSRDTEKTYSKPSKRNAAGLLQVKQTGMGSIKPGEREVEGDKKDVLLIVDDSGSVLSTIKSIYVELFNLFKKYGKKNLGNIYLIKFSSSFRVYRVDIKEKKAYLIKNIEELKRKLKNNKEDDVDISQEKSLRVLLSSVEGAGTDFDSKLADLVDIFLKKGYNSIMFTDSDITWSSNLKNIKRIITRWGKKPFRFNLFITDKSEYNEVVKKIDYKYMTYLQK